MRLLLGIIFLLLFSAFFSGTETAIFSLSSLERKRLAAQHPHRSSWVERLIRTPQRTLISLLIGNVLVNTLASVLITLFTLHYLGSGWLGLTMVIFTLALLFFGEISPKLFAVRRNEEWASFTAIPLNLFAVALWPIRKVVRFITDKVMYVLIPSSPKHVDEDSLAERSAEATFNSEDELRTLVGISAEEGVLPYEETQMIRKLLALGDRQVKEIMTPRTQIIGFDVEEEVGALIETIRTNHISFIVVYQKSVDNIIGLLSTERFMLSDRTSVKSLLVPVYFIPETKKIDELFLEFQKDKREVAIAVDEHGGTAGLVADEDILEEIFGEIYDEYESPRQMVQRISAHEFIVNGKIPLSEFNEFFSSNFSSESEETLAGFLLEKLGHIPVHSEQMKHDRWIFTILSLEGRRIDQVRVVKT